MRDSSTRSTHANDVSGGPITLLHAVADLLKTGMPSHLAWAKAGILVNSLGVPIHQALVKAILERSTPLTVRTRWTPAARKAHREAEELATILITACAAANRLGISLRAILATVEEAYECEVQARSERRIALAGPRASARLLQLLPVVGLFAAASLGTNTLAWFTSSILGAIVCGAGMILLCAGRIWTRRLIQRAEGRSQ